MGYPHRIAYVSDHAMVRYLERIEQENVASVRRYLVSQGMKEDDDPIVLQFLEARGINVKEHRMKILADAEIHKREAKDAAGGKFSINGRLARYIVNAQGACVVTVIHKQLPAKYHIARRFALQQRYAEEEQA